MSYAQYNFTEFESEIIEEYFPGISYEEEREYCYYYFEHRPDIDFRRRICEMMSDKRVRKSNVVDFWVDSVQEIFIAKGLGGSRNIWEYYVYTCKELNK